MENASKALLMAAGILVGVLILALMVTLFLSSRELSTEYEKTKQTEAVQQFNVNFTKYLGQYITTHEAVTIINFAEENNVYVDKSGYTFKMDDDISRAYSYYRENYINKNNIENTRKVEIVYKINDVKYDENGYVSQIKIYNRKYKITTYFSDGREPLIEIKTN